MSAQQTHSRSGQQCSQSWTGADTGCKLGSWCRPFLVGDMPFGSYETSPQAAVQNAVRIMKEGSMDAVKMEGVHTHLAAYQLSGLLCCGIIDSVASLTASMNVALLLAFLSCTVHLTCCERSALVSS